MPKLNNPTLVLPHPGEVVIEDLPVPKVPEGRVLVKTECTLVSIGTELTILAAEYSCDSAWNWASQFPRNFGYSNIGTVIEVGKKVDREWIGKRVATRGKHAAYVTSPVPTINRFFVPNTILMTEPVNEKVTSDQAAFFALALIALNGVRKARIELGQGVVVYGMGLVGQLAARFCHLNGARPVIGVDVHEFRLKKLPRKHGFVALNNHTNTELPARIQKENQGRFADVVFETTGNEKIIVDELSALKNRGRFVVLSSPKGPTSFNFNDHCLSRNLTIIGAHENSQSRFETADNPWTRKRNLEYFFDCVAGGELELQDLITHKVAYNEAPCFYKKLLRDRSNTLGVIFDWRSI